MTGAEDPNAEAIAGLASELEALRRAVEPLPGRIDEVAALVVELTGRIRNQPARPGPQAVPSWLVAPADQAVTNVVLEELSTWVIAVFLRYVDSDVALPDCWLWHPEIVEELLWLMHSWLAAYQGESASVALVGDWHDRYRPGVVRRIKAIAGTCSLETHEPGREDWKRRKRRPDAVARIARWWAETRHELGPAPTAEDMVDPGRVPR